MVLLVLTGGPFAVPALADPPVRADGYADAAPEQASGTATGAGHRAPAASTAAGGRLPARKAVRPDGAVADRLSIPARTGDRPAVARPVPARLTPGPAAAGFDAKRSRRLPGRDAATTEFTNPDGTRTLRLHTQPVNVRQPDGSWLPVDTRLKRDGAGWRTARTSYRLTVRDGAAGEPLAEIVAENGERTVVDEPGRRVVRPVVRGSTATFAGVRPGVDLRLTATGSGVRKDLIFKDAETVSVVIAAATTVGVDADDTFVMSGLGDQSNSPDLQVGTPDGGRTAGRAYFHFGQLATRLRDQYINGASLVLLNNYATSCAPAPVTVFEVASPWSGSSLRWPGAPVNAAYDTRSFAHRGLSGGCPAAWEALRVDPDAATRWTHGAAFHGLGVRASNERDTAGFKRFAAAESVNPPYLDVTYAPEGAAYQTDELLQPTNNAPGRIRVRATNLGSSTWQAGGGYRLGLTVKRGGQVVAAPAPVAPATNVGPMGVATIDLTIPPLAPDEYTLEIGMVNPQGQDFNSAYGVPKGTTPMKVTNVRPAVNYQQPGSGAGVGSIVPTLYASGVNPDNWPADATLKYDFKICGGTPDAPTGCHESGWTGQTWTPPAGALRWSETYFWWVRAHDGADAGPYAGPLTLRTQVPQPEITARLAGSPDSVQAPGLDPSIGNYSTMVTDASVATAGPDLTVVRTYNSLDPRRDSAFGLGWASRVDMRLSRDIDTSGSVVVTLPTGRQVRFGRNTDGTYAAPQGQALTLTYDSATGRWTQRDATGSRWIFDVLGRLITVADPAGLTETLRYDANDHVYEIRNDTSGRKLTLGWQNGRVATVQANDGPVWTYAYEGSRLTRVCAPGAAPNCTTYHYGTGSHYRSSVADDGPRAYWRLGETTGTTATSATARAAGLDGGRYDGVVLGGAGAIAGTADRAAVFDGVNSRVDLPAEAASRSMSLTAEMWFKTTDAGVLLSSQKGAAYPEAAEAWTPILYVGTDGLLYGGFPVPKPAGPRQAVSNAAVNDGAWHHAVLSAAIDTQTLYVDGVAQQVTASGVIDHRGQTQLTLGAGQGKDWPATTGDRFPFAGSIDEVALYEHSLGPLAVRQHFDAARSIDLLTGITLPQDDRRYVTVAYDDTLDRVRTLTDNWNRVWNLDPPVRDQAVRKVTLHGPYPDWTYTFDADNGGRTVSKTHDGATESYRYNVAGFLAAVVDPDGREARFTTDRRGNVLSTTTCRAANSCNTSYAGYFLNAGEPLDPRNDRLISSSDARSSGPEDNRFKTVFEYDPAGRPLKYTYPLPAGVTTAPVETWRYATGSEPAEGGGTVPAGLLLVATGRRGQTTTHSYARTGDLVSTTSPTGLRTRYAYDSLGRVRETTPANSGGVAFGTTTTTWTERSQVKTVTEPAVTNAVTGKRHQRITTYDYDGNGNRTAVTVGDTTPAAEGGDAPRTTAYRYDASDRLTLTTFPDGRTESRGYSLDGLQIDTTDRAGTVWHDRYDDQRRLLARSVEGAGVDPQNPSATAMALEFRSYDPAGDLATVTDATGRLTRFTYYGDGLPATVVRENHQDDDGTTRSVVLGRQSYDPAGNVSELVEAGGRATTYTYDPAGLPRTETVDPAGEKRVTEYTRDADGNATRTTLTGAAQPGRQETRLTEYGPDGQPTHMHAVLGDGVQITMVTTYDERGLPIAVRDPRGQTTTVGYDATGRMTSAVQPAVDVWRDGVRTPGVRPVTVTARNAFGEPTHEKDPNGNVDVTGFDAMGRVQSVTSPAYTPPGGAPLTATTQIGYDALGRANRVTDPLGRVTTSVFDPYGDLLSETAPPVGDAPSTTRYTYSRTGELLSTTTPGGAQTRSTYNTLGHEVTRTLVERVPGPASFLITRFAHDDAGRVRRITTPQGNVTTATYNTAGDQITRTDPTGRTSTFTYDIAGRLRTTTDPSGLVAEASYDLLGRPSGVTDSKNGSVLRRSAVEYDAAGNPVATVSGEGRRQTLGYDALGRVVTRTSRTGDDHSITIGLGYDAAGNTTRYVDGNGRATTYTFNSWGLAESTVEPSTAAHPDPAQRTFTTGYDAAGQAVREVLPGGVERTREFDAQGRLTVERGSGAETATADRRLGYDADGRLTLAGGPRGDTTYRYNDRGGLVESAGAAGTETYAYFADGGLQSRTDATGTATFTYDAAGRQASMADPVSGRTVDFGYDAAGRLGNVTDRSAPRVSRVLRYDDLGRLERDVVEQRIDSGVPPRNLLGATYAYDLDDKVTGKTEIRDGQASASSYDYDDAGRLVEWTRPDGTTTSYGWDDAGNRTRAGPRTATYDERNRLLTDGTTGYTYSPRGTLSSAGGRATSFDAFERLVSDGTTSYAYDALDRVASHGDQALLYQGPTNAVVSDGQRLVSRDATGAPFADKAATAGSGTGHQLYADQHGDVTGRYRSAVLGGSRSYDPFGSPTATSGESPSVGYQGGWTDAATGAVNMASRWYDPGTGAFLSRDTLTVDPDAAGAGNRYAYAQADPLGLTDPTGHEPGGWGSSFEQFAHEHCIPGKNVSPLEATMWVLHRLDPIDNLFCLYVLAWDMEANWHQELVPGGARGGNTSTNRLTNYYDDTFTINDRFDSGGGGGRGWRPPLPPPPPPWIPPLFVPIPPPPPGTHAQPRPPRVPSDPPDENRIDPGPGITDSFTRVEDAPIIDAGSFATIAVAAAAALGAGESLHDWWQKRMAKSNVRNNERYSYVDLVDDPNGSAAYDAARQGCFDGSWNGGPIRYAERDTGGRAVRGEACYQGVLPSGGTPVGNNLPPGLPSPDMAAGHLIAHSLGGSGTDLRNLTPIYQRMVNVSGMYAGAERIVAILVKDLGQTVYYRVEPIYDGANPVPTHLRIIIATPHGGVLITLQNDI
ncbi:RHS repeat-associated core domain-containing protein [Actinoplanes sp. NBRC 103695]|uniref:RHS repeat-associated core domain-containing protein n=1 Tax=Actinoplanes sp. NBRC 103695 TaxID=3032202 RepID=UPI0024A4558E|nr:RHS repeat-associated core domain-containing protein [Actinoplanes sp. NBRC 103695]GLY96489.1 hypothetical protein Acsp02_37440 [Actinoplanes sp. NBRC 103695]